MFIKNSFYNYNAQELLLTTSRLAFALDACVALILIMELIMVLFIVNIVFSKKRCEKIKLNPLFWVCTITLPTCLTNNYDTIAHHSWFASS
jgi:hypothetical protein